MVKNSSKKRDKDSEKY